MSCHGMIFLFRASDVYLYLPQVQVVSLIANTLNDGIDNGFDFTASAFLDGQVIRNNHPNRHNILYRTNKLELIWLLRDDVVELCLLNISRGVMLGGAVLGSLTIFPTLLGFE